MPPSLDWSAVGPYRCWVNPPFASPALEADLAQLSVRLASPAVRVLQEGRHRTVRLPLGPADAPLDAVVKAFGRQSPLMDRFARAGRGTKAMRTCMAAVHLAEHGIDTPPPIACLERWEGSRLVESYFLSRHVDGMTDFRDELIRLFRTRAECACFMELLDRVAQAVRRLHDAGFQHRDLGNQNILLGPGATMAERRVYFIDLNRGVCHARPLTPGNGPATFRALRFPRTSCASSSRWSGGKRPLPAPSRGPSASTVARSPFTVPPASSAAPSAP